MAKGNDIQQLFTLEHFERRLSSHSPRTISRLTAPKRAAVAALLRFDDRGADVLVMKRAEHEGDRWSGHVSFPGGRAEPEDRDLLHTAVRETREEMGLSLDSSARLLGQLGDVRAIGKGRVLPMAITPFVFVQEEHEELELNHEAEAAFWLPLHEVYSGALNDTFSYNAGPVPMRFGCWRYQDYIVWGLTYRMIKTLMGVIGGD